MTEPESKKEKLLGKIISGRAALEEALARIREQEMETPILHDGWSVKDLLGHLGFWEGFTATRFSALRAGETPESFGNMDALNARTLANTRLLPLAAVRRGEQESYRQLLGMVQEAAPDELFKADYFPGRSKNPLAGWIAGDTWQHYKEHLPELRAWLDKKS